MEATFFKHRMVADDIKINQIAYHCNRAAILQLSPKPIYSKIQTEILLIYPRWLNNMFSKLPAAIHKN